MTIKTPLHCASVDTGSSTGPAAGIRDWLEFGLVLGALATWIAYWADLHYKGLV